jgi:methylmalonyl-CoA mutase N-terminal domain/subunit
MEIADSAYKFQRQLESKEKIMVGMNKYVTEVQQAIPLVEIDEKIGEEQIKRLKDIRRRRDNRATKKSLDDIKNACKTGKNVMPYCIEAVKNLATQQEICDVYREVYGEYRDPGLY